MKETYEGIYCQVNVVFSNRFGNQFEITKSANDKVKTLKFDSAKYKKLKTASAREIDQMFAK